MRPKRILLIRHGESRSNRARALSGRGDTDLTPRGKSQVKKVSRFIKKRFLTVDRIYSSPLKRALHTATLLSKRLDTPVTADELLLETDFGAWEGMSRDLLMSQPGWDSYTSDPFHFIFPDGESPQDVKNRVQRFREKLFADGGWDTIVVVSHYTPIVFFILKALGDEQRTRAPFTIANASLTVLESTDRGDYIGMMNYTP
jgi:broad specificity phosphatase PhoE